MSMLSKANETMEEASEKDTTEETKEKKAGEESETDGVPDSASETQGESVAEELEAVIPPVRQYTPVDVRL